MKEKLIINLYWLHFQEEEKGLEGRFKKHTIRWNAIYTDRNNKVHEKSGDAISIHELFLQLQSWYGGELKDLNNECHVEVRSPPTMLAGETFLATKKYHVRREISFDEMCELGCLLNQLKQGAHENQRRMNIKTLQFSEPDKMPQTHRAID